MRVDSVFAMIQIIRTPHTGVRFDTRKPPADSDGLQTNSFRLTGSGQPTSGIIHPTSAVVFLLTKENYERSHLRIPPGPFNTFRTGNDRITRNP